jgi:hypothetical protein
MNFAYRAALFCAALLSAAAAARAAYVEPASPPPSEEERGPATAGGERPIERYNRTPAAEARGDSPERAKAGCAGCPERTESACATLPIEAIGATTQDLTREDARARGTLVQSGALVMCVERRGPASESGLRCGDVIIALNGNPVGTAQELEDALALLPPGVITELTLVRDQVTMPRRVRLAVPTAAEQGPP